MPSLDIGSQAKRANLWATLAGCGRCCRSCCRRSQGHNVRAALTATLHRRDCERVCLLAVDADGLDARSEDAHDSYSVRLCLSPAPEVIMEAVGKVLDDIIRNSEGVPSIAALFLNKAPPAQAAQANAMPRYLSLYPGHGGGKSDLNASARLDAEVPPAPQLPQHLPAISQADGVVEFARRVIRSVVRHNLQDAATVLELYAPYEYLLTEQTRLSRFLAAEPTLEECDSALADVCSCPTCLCLWRHDGCSMVPSLCCAVPRCRSGHQKELSSRSARGLAAGALL